MCDKNYFLVAKVTENEEVTEEFKLLEETEVAGQKALQLVTDEKVIELLAKYFSPKQ